MGPEGAPEPPECPIRVTGPAGAAPHPATRTPREAPFEGQSEAMIRARGRAGISFLGKIF